MPQKKKKTTKKSSARSSSRSSKRPKPTNSPMRWVEPEQSKKNPEPRPPEEVENGAGRGEEQEIIRQEHINTPRRGEET